MAHLYNSGHAVVNSDPNSIALLQSNHNLKYAISSDGESVWVFKESNPAGQKWVSFPEVVDANLNTTFDKEIVYNITENKLGYKDVTDTGWQSLALTSVDFGAGTFEIRRKGNKGYIRCSSFSGGGSSSNPYIFTTLPVGYRPESVQFGTFNGSDNVVKQLKIFSNGNLGLDRPATGFNEFLIDYVIEI